MYRPEGQSDKPTPRLSKTRQVYDGWLPKYPNCPTFNSSGCSPQHADTNSYLIVLQGLSEYLAISKERPSGNHTQLQCVMLSPVGEVLQLFRRLNKFKLSYPYCRGTCEHVTETKRPSKVAYINTSFIGPVPLMS